MPTTMCATKCRKWLITSGRFLLSEQTGRGACRQKTLVVCGVSFMGESAKILNPGKRVLLPDPKADCAMAHMITPEKVAALRQAHPKAAVVCYINSTAELKTCSDVCVTSANALKIVRALPNEEIIFIPDEKSWAVTSPPSCRRKPLFSTTAAAPSRKDHGCGYRCSQSRSSRRAGAGTPRMRSSCD